MQGTAPTQTAAPTMRACSRQLPASCRSELNQTWAVQVGCGGGAAAGSCLPSAIVWRRGAQRVPAAFAGAWMPAAWCGPALLPLSFVLGPCHLCLETCPGASCLCPGALPPVLGNLPLCLLPLPFTCNGAPTPPGPAGTHPPRLHADPPPPPPTHPMQAPTQQACTWCIMRHWRCACHQRRRSPCWPWRPRSRLEQAATLLPATLLPAKWSTGGHGSGRVPLLVDPGACGPDLPALLAVMRVSSAVGSPDQALVAHLLAPWPAGLALRPPLLQPQQLLARLPVAPAPRPPPSSCPLPGASPAMPRTQLPR